MKKDLSAYFPDQNHTLSLENECLTQRSDLTNHEMHLCVEGHTALYTTEAPIHTLTYQVIW